METTLEKGLVDIPPFFYFTLSIKENVQENELLSQITHVQTIQSSEEIKANQLNSIQSSEKWQNPLKMIQSCRGANCKDIKKKSFLFSKLAEI